jgi:uncharacterized YccA/Bax inhibitor family protein
MRSSNPALNSTTFENLGLSGSAATMTIDGTVNKTALLLLLVVAPAFYVWRIFFQSGNPAAVMPYVLGGAIGGLIVALITAFKKEWSPATAPIYAVLEGLFLGGISATFEARFPGIVLQAVALTFGTLFCLLMAYKSRMIQVTQNFRMGVFAATGAIALFYLVTFVLSFFKIQIPGLFGSGLVGILFSLAVVVIAALNLVLDFDFIERGAESGAPKFMEWYGAFALMVTLIWLYLEILRLLSKVRDRR